MSILSNLVAHALPVQTKLQDGAYVIGPVLGQGGFGITYWGGDARLHRYVAIKEFFPSVGSVRNGKNVHLSNNFSIREFDELKTQFINEARALAQFRHPNIVHVFTFFEENNTAYMVMEYLKGKSLLNMVEEKGPLPEKESLDYIDKVADALKAVHGAKMLHRDVNPGNVIVCNDDRVVLIDFGLTKRIEAPTLGLGTRRLSRTSIFGTEGYAPPEQYVRAADLGTYTDVYALGATLYFLLTAKSPVSSTERLYGQPLPAIKSLRSIVSCTVSDAVAKAMELKENERSQTIEDFVSELKAKAASPATHTNAAIVSPYTPSAVVPTSTFNSPPLVQQHSTRVAAGSSGNTTSVSTAAGLQKAVKRAEPGDTIWLRSGIYRLTETLDINKSIALKGDGGKCKIASVIEGIIVSLRGDCDWLIQDVEFERTSNSTSVLLRAECGIIQIKRCIFNGFSSSKSSPLGTGLLFNGFSKGLVEECQFNFHNCGSYFDKKSQIRISDCKFEFNHFGIVYAHESIGVSHQTYFSSNQSAITVLDQARPTILNNNFHYNESAILYFDNSAGIAQGNIISNNFTGISLHDHANPRMAKNQFGINQSRDINDER